MDIVGGLLHPPLLGDLQDPLAALRVPPLHGAPVGGLQIAGTVCLVFLVETGELGVDGASLAGLGGARLDIGDNRRPARIGPQRGEVGIGGQAVGVATAPGRGLVEELEGEVRGFLLAGPGGAGSGAQEGPGGLAVLGGDRGGGLELLGAAHPVGLLVEVGRLVPRVCEAGVHRLQTFASFGGGLGGGGGEGQG